MAKNYYLHPKPSNILFEKIMRRINKEEYFLILRRRVLGFLIMMVSFTVFTEAIFKVKVSFELSGFINIFSLAFSDFEAVSIYWKDFIFAVLGLFPIMEVIFMCATFFAFLVSLKVLAKSISSVKYRNQPTQI